MSLSFPKRGIPAKTRCGHQAQRAPRRRPPHYLRSYPTVGKLSGIVLQLAQSLLDVAHFPADENDLHVSIRVDLLRSQVAHQCRLPQQTYYLVDGHPQRYRLRRAGGGRRARRLRPVEAAAEGPDACAMSSTSLSAWIADSACWLTSVATLESGGGAACAYAAVTGGAVEAAG